MSNYTATIGGSLVNVVAGSLHIEQNLGARSTGGMQVWSALGTVWQYGTQCQVYDETNALVYNGFVVKDTARKAGGARQGTGYLEHELTLMDQVYKADKRRAVGAFLNVSAGSIVKTLVDTTLAAEGVTYTSTSIAPGATIIEAIWTYNKSVSEAITWLATQCGFWWLIDLNGVLFFQPYGGTSAPFVLDGTQADTMQDLSVEFGNDLYVNSEYAKGSFAEKGTKAAPLDETFTGDGARRAFTLRYEVSHVYQVLVNGVDVTAGLLTKDESGGQWYYQTGDAVIAQDTSLAVLTSGDTLEVKYTGRYPILANARNNALITAQKTREGGGTGLVESEYSNTKVKTEVAAFQIAQALLAHYGQDTTLLTFSTRSKGLAPGQLLTVNLSDFGLTARQMLVSGVTITDQVDGYNIWYTVQCVGSPYDAAQFQTYWQNLMNQSSDPSDLTDTQDGTALALIDTASCGIAWNTSLSASGALVCPLCGNATLCSSSLIIC